MRACGWLGCALALGVLLTVQGSRPSHAADPKALRVCLEQNSGLYSFKRGARHGGFDVLVAQAVAEHLGRPLVIQWFASEADDENNPVLEANALLSAGLCHLVGGYAYIRAALGATSHPAWTLPDYEGRRRRERGRKVPLGILVAGRPYHFAPLTVVLGAGVRDRRVERLAALADLRLGSEVSTLASAILMRYASGLLIDRVTHVRAGGGLLRRLAAGAFDATLVELHRFDAYRARHPETRLRATQYRHSIGFNMGFVALQTSHVLLSHVNDAIEALQARNTFAELARRVGLTYVAPQQPAIFERILPRMLQQD